MLKKGAKINDIALAQKVSRISVWTIQKKYEEWGENGLKDHKPGRLFEPLNNNFYDLVKEE